MHDNALIPFGAKVWFKPGEKRGHDQDHKFDPESIPRVFAGYRMGPGLWWNRQYEVWPLSEFVKRNLAYDASKRSVGETSHCGNGRAG